MKRADYEKQLVLQKIEAHRAILGLEWEGLKSSNPLGPAMQLAQSAKALIGGDRGRLARSASLLAVPAALYALFLLIQRKKRRAPTSAAES